jgi:hypothetical protein
MGRIGKVRRLQRKPWAAAKQSEGRRFHALYDRVCRGDVLWEAWERVMNNRGAAGVDKLTLDAVEGYGVGRMLAELQADLRAGVYRPAPVRRVEIPKPDGGRRPLGIRGPEPDPARLGQLLADRQRRQQVHPGRRLRRPAAAQLDDQEAWS